MLESQREQAERRRMMLDEARARDRLREQGSTFLAQTHSEMGGRFSSVGAQTVIGADPVANYPAAAPHQRDPCGIEPPLGYSVNQLTPHELEPSLAHPLENPPQGSLGDPANAPLSASSPLVSERAGSPLSQTGDSAGVSIPSPPDTFMRNVDVGSSPLLGRRL
jgi:hypothetical protein